jgi:hypothetical protein
VTAYGRRRKAAPQKLGVEVVKVPGAELVEWERADLWLDVPEDRTPVISHRVRRTKRGDVLELPVQQVRYAARVALGYS